MGSVGLEILEKIVKCWNFIEDSSFRDNAYLVLVVLIVFGLML